MPAFEPGGKLRIVLDSDVEKNPKPTFIVKALSRRESMKLLSRLENMPGTLAEQSAELDAMFAEYLLDWENMGVPFSLDALGDILGNQETWRLVYQIARQVGDYEKKA